MARWLKLKKAAEKIVRLSRMMAERKKDSEKKKEKRSHERPFQVFLIVFGFVLGTLGTYIWEARHDRRHKESMVRVIKASVQQEVRLAKNLREYLATKEDVERLVPQGFDSIHDPGVYLSLQGSLGQLDDALLLDLHAFHRTMQSCINMRKLFQEGLLWCQKNKGKPLPEGYRENYITVLAGLELRGQQVISTIETLYPDVKLDTSSQRAEPRVEQLDFDGYIQQE